MKALKAPAGQADTPRFLITSPLTFSDQIAFDQLVLAIERNLLLHITTGLNMIVVGLAMFRFFSRNPNDLYAAIGIAAFCVAALVIFKGVLDFVRIRKDLSLMGRVISEHRREIAASRGM